MRRDGELRWNPEVAERLLGMGDEAGAERGHMFGYPALYARGKLAVCAFGDGIGLKLPAERVTELLDSGRAKPFQPYGISGMREWVHLSAGNAADLDEVGAVVGESLAFVGGQARPTPENVETAIDHLLYGAPDLETGMDEIERRLGTRPSPGGQHPAYGTRNALLSLGPTCYLEVIAPDPELPTPDRGIGFGVGGLTEPRLVSWAMRHPAIDAAAGTGDLGSVEHGRRDRDDGSVLRWRLTDPYEERMGGVIPFLIDWGETPHPGSSAPGGGRLIELRIEHPAPERVRDVLATLRCTGVPVDRGDAPRLVALIRTADGTVELT